MLNNFLLAADKPAILHGASGELLVSVILIIGMLAGVTAKKLKLPVLTGQIIAGILVGPYMLNLIGHTEEKNLTAVTSFAIGLIALTVGSHLNFQKLHNSFNRNLLIAVGESSCAFIAVFFALEYFNPMDFSEQTRLAAHLLISSLACSTSPATVLHVIKEKNAKGNLVRTLLIVVALDNIICLLVFESVRAVARQKLSGASLLTTALPGLISFFSSIIVGFIVAKCFEYCLKFLEKRQGPSHFRRNSHTLVFTLLVASIMITNGLCDYMAMVTAELPQKLTPLPIMANLVLGLCLTNFAIFKNEMLEQFEVLEQFIFTVFFTLAGMHLDLRTINQQTITSALIYLVAMAGGKMIGATFGAMAGRCTPRTTLNIGSMLLVQAGMTIALLVVIYSEKDFSPLHAKITAMILLVVVFTELVGTILISKTLDRVKETGKKRTRLIDFLDEEHIITGLNAKNKWEALREMSYFLVKTNDIEIDPEELLKRMEEREKEFSTGFGQSIAIPHCTVTDEESHDGKIRGMLAVCTPGVEFESMDDEPVEIIVMLATPESQREAHLEILSVLGRMLSDATIREQILKANCAASIYEIIHSEEAETFNYFLK
ncbi:probable fructose specific permease-possibly phosphotransferase system component [Lentisphaera araneosa HTCC2155]|uniref:Probable fructose specific permease-possibly phosphotransferase system component n=1 Tax=Lentisphaera araneosa HTCC2155 TaxID=313628 RepID=A6DML2_9BACT|nr:fused Na/H antiporter/PTS fructose transporter subunit IIA [Lentisphaera araneosa]EDM27202.1 probable fructose specific permease-possibly phosphotransferase system component [Lentisphaera araneosa HTCC2155]